MPLIQWIMQNLTPPAGGVLAAGNANAYVEYLETATGQALLAGEAVEFVIRPGQFAGVKAGGSAFYNQIVNVVGVGGTNVGGKAFIETASKRTIKYPPTTTVYNSKNKWIVVSFSYASAKAEGKYVVTNNIKNETFYESELKTEPVYLFGNFDDSTEFNFPLFEGRQLVEIPRSVIYNGISFEGLKELRKPFNNFPVSSGIKTITFKTVRKEVSFPNQIPEMAANLPVYSGEQNVLAKSSNAVRPTVPINVLSNNVNNYPVYPGIKKVQQ